MPVAEHDVITSLEIVSSAAQVECHQCNVVFFCVDADDGFGFLMFRHDAMEEKKTIVGTLLKVALLKVLT